VTQILTRASLNYVLQVSDLRVTKDGSLFDYLANKSVILSTENSVVAMSYTGHAFIDAVPTDQWIVEILRGQRFDRSRKPPAMTLGGSSALQLPDLGRNLDRIRIAIDEIPRMGSVPLRHFREWFREPFEIAFAGWLWYRKGRARPVVGSISKPSRSLTASVRYLPRSALNCGKVGFIAVPSGHASRERFRALYERLLRLSPSETREALIDQIRQLAKESPLVGADCLSICLRRPVWGPINVEYLPVNPTTAHVVGSTMRARIHVALSPWILGQGACYAPSMISGVFHISLDGFDVRMSGPSSSISIFSSLTRPAQP
jgi:hypothetical protein